MTEIFSVFKTVFTVKTKLNVYNAIWAIFFIQTALVVYLAIKINTWKMTNANPAIKDVLLVAEEIVTSAPLAIVQKSFNPPTNVCVLEELTRILFKTQIVSNVKALKFEMAISVFVLMGLIKILVIALAVI